MTTPKPYTICLNCGHMYHSHQDQAGNLGQAILCKGGGTVTPCYCSEFVQAARPTRPEVNPALGQELAEAGVQQTQEASKNQEFMDLALARLQWVCEHHHQFTVDDFWRDWDADLGEASSSSLGPVMRAGKKREWMHLTGGTRKSAIASQHGGHVRVWESHLFVAAMTAPLPISEGGPSYFRGVDPAKPGADVGVIHWPPVGEVDAADVVWETPDSLEVEMVSTMGVHMSPEDWAAMVSENYDPDEGQPDATQH